MPKLSDLGTLRTGYQLRGAAKPDDFGANLLIQQGDLKDDRIDFSRGLRMSLERSERDLLAQGDVLLRGRGTTYGAVLVSGIPDNAVAIAPLVVFRPNRQFLLPEYLVWYINRPATQAALAAEARGTYIPTVNTRTFGDLEIVVPPFDKQAQVAETMALLQQERQLTEQILTKRAQVTHAFLERLIQD